MQLASNQGDSRMSMLPGSDAQTLLALMHARAEAERLGEREQLFSTLLGGVNAVLWAFDWQAQRMIYVSPAYERIFGRSPALLLADYGEWRNAIYPDDVEYAQKSMLAVLDEGAVETREYRIIRGDGQLRWLSDKCFLGRRAEHGHGPIIVGIAEDITEKKQLEGELQRLATTDVLTQSSNRRYFFECARTEFERARQFASPLAFLLLDIDDFKRINDTHGHQMGDQVLQKVARCGASVLRQSDLFGRIGGEEFAALLPGCQPDLAEQIAERLQREIERLVFTAENGERFRVTASLGLTYLKASDPELSAVFARADAAMYTAKRLGKNQVIVG
ncbi:MAG: sensor domain-containing diguanylate cyclase [Pseudomonas sp.]|jgi:diguanylate cyclase (GGDEF)-like protein/PAS domain S-box-containing protein|uniref:diguanylate cyclase n=1 Tax=Stutzerimonas frequens TaxID=2968969 RepID=A0AA47E4K6_9GAMM|nr:sensor domain-containing diguanylate cyclase [Stutzerimonas frequens]MAL93275.1 diguanylate cyclase [Pseudomonas sp.]NCT80271.1 sensor domain-containing diguanylate cyclase [Stutzerimonas stutzeri]MBA4726493.1 sensor domain-containing diguanylate cyclase [Pseudomonas sp.]MBK3918973.1 diguanylate cyclase [Stutzerimonas frequens]QFU10437.1 putative diguanylate cyclase YcdT [Stutzerimonas frequens]|tara:strand:- start:1425 stop:2423 length:999 start_codon:yes stop_codon:yes gene_type:complete